MGKSSIEWTEQTWSPVRGCSRISPGCGGAAGVGGCYAEKIAARFSGPDKHGKPGPYAGFAEFKDGVARWTRKVALIPDQLDIPLRRKIPTTYFVDSMSDTFHEKLTNEEIGAVFGVMAAARQHTFQVLTKRGRRLPQWFEWIAEQGAELMAVVGETPGPNTSAEGSACVHLLGEHYDLGDRAAMTAYNNAPWPLPNVHLGVSVESAEYKWRIDELRKTPAVQRFLSIEPLLEDVGVLDLTGIHLVIVGAESGTGARKMNEDWVRSVRDQCIEQGVEFVYKQRLDNKGHKVSLPILDGRQWTGMA